MDKCQYFNCKMFENELLKKYNLRLENQNNNLTKQFKNLNNQYSILSDIFEYKINYFINHNLLEFQKINIKNKNDYDELHTNYKILINNYNNLKDDYFQLKLEFEQSKKKDENQSLLYNLKFFNWL